MNPAATTSAPGAAQLTHAALLYRDPDHLRLVVAEFARAAADGGEPLLAALPPASNAVLADVLEGAGGEVERVDMAGAGRNPARLLPMLLDWMADRVAPVRVVAEALWAERGQAEVAEVLRNEALINHALADVAVNILCPFNTAHLGDEILAGAELTHPWVIDGSGERPSDTFGDPLELARGDRWPQPPPRPPIVDLEFDGDLRALRHRLAEEPLLAGLAPDRAGDLIFGVNEAASNALCHGDGTCRTRLWQDGGRVVAEVRSATRIDDPLAGRRRPSPEATSGRGLWLINQICDLVELRSTEDGASLRMHFVVA